MANWGSKIKKVKFRSKKKLRVIAGIKKGGCGLVALFTSLSGIVYSARIKKEDAN